MSLVHCVFEGRIGDVENVNLQTERERRHSIAVASLRLS